MPISRHKQIADRLVEWIEKSKADPSQSHLKPADSIVIAHEDGSDRSLGFLGMSQDPADFADTVYEAVLTHRRMARELGTVPAC